MTSNRSISFEIRLTVCTLVFTLAATALFLVDMARSASTSPPGHWIELIGFTLIIAFLIYGIVGYELTRIGHLQRRFSHAPRSRSELEALHDGPAAPLVFLVPSYREEALVAGAVAEPVEGVGPLLPGLPLAILSSPSSSETFWTMLRRAPSISASTCTSWYVPS